MGYGSSESKSNRGNYYTEKCLDRKIQAEVRRPIGMAVPSGDLECITPRQQPNLEFYSPAERKSMKLDPSN